MCIVNTMTTWGSSRRGSKGRPFLHVRCQHEGDVSFVPLCGVRCLQRVGSLRQEGDSPDRTSPSSSLPPLPHPPAVIPMSITSFPPLLTSFLCPLTSFPHPPAVIPASPHIILVSSHVIPSSSCRHSYAHHVIPASPHIILAFSHVIPAKAGIQPTASDAHSYAPAQGWTGARGVLSCETNLPSNGLSTQRLVVL